LGGNMNTEKSQKTYKIIMLIVLTILITAIITTILVYKTMDGNVKYVTVSSNSSEIGKTLESLKNWIQDKYIGDIDEKQMVETAIKGYVAGLDDKYSEYITAEEMKEYMEEAVGKFVGIGVYIMNDTEKNQILVIAPIEGGPAAEAGILPGDIITKIDGVEYKGEQLSEASSKLKQEAGTKVKLEILRDSKTIEIEVERRKIKTSHVTAETIDNNIGYINLPSFDEDTSEEFIQKYKELGNKNIKGLIIDLRNNGGGIVEEALKIADTMVDKGNTLLIITSKNKEEEIKKSEKDKTINVPIVVLVNENTASASEILVAALRENINAKVVGKTTYGKGVIQTIYTFKDGSGLKLTTNEYLTPNRNSINKIGIKPDYEIELPENEKNIYAVEKEQDTQLKKAIELFK